MQPHQTLNLTQESQRFQEIVEHCRKLDRAGLIFSGVEFYLLENGIIAIKPRQSKEVWFGNPPRLFRLEEATETLLTHLQQTRHELGVFFNLDSSRWNASPIGKALSTMEKMLREQHYKTESHATGRGGTYNVRTIHFLFSAMTELLQLILNEPFKKSWRWRKLRLLNQWGTNFIVWNQEQAILRTLHMHAQLILCLGERLDLHGSEGIEDLIDTIANTQMLEHLKTQFGEI